MPDHFHHAPHLTVAAFVQGELNQRVVFGLRPHTSAARRGLTVFEVNARFQLLERRHSDVAFDTRPIHFLDAVRRVRQKLRQRAVVGQEQRARRVVIEPPDGVQMLELIGQKVRDCSSSFGVFFGGDDAGRLVHQQHDGRAGRQFERLAVHRDAVMRWIGALARLGHDVAVDRNTPGGNQFFGGAAAGQTGSRQQLLQALTASRRCRIGRCRFGRCGIV